MSKGPEADILMPEELQRASGGRGKKVMALNGLQSPYWGPFCTSVYSSVLGAHLPQAPSDQNAPCLWFPLPSPLGSESCSVSVKGVCSESRGAAGWEARTEQCWEVRGYSVIWGEGGSRQSPWSLDKTHRPGGRSEEEGREEACSASSVPKVLSWPG